MTEPKIISLFPEGIEVGVGITDPQRPGGTLFPVEADSIARAVPKRQDEFRAGRTAARLAMQAVGAAAVALPARADRSPEWPKGIAGSISHCEDLCMACASTEARAIGLDVEPASDLAEDLWDTILLPAERDAVLASTAPGQTAKLIFSAKEAAYKAQYPLSETLFGFHDLGIQLVGSDQFQATFHVQAGPFQPGDQLNGRHFTDDSHIMTAVVVA
jgi:4'-phosphopantetheinyl transferase EntD